MSDLGKQIASLKGRFPGEQEDALPRVLVQLVTTGQIAPPTPELIAKLHRKDEAPAAPVAQAEPEEAPDEPEQAAPEPEETPDEPEQAAPEPEEAPDEPEQAAPEPEEAPDEPEQAAPEPEEEPEAAAPPEKDMPEAVDRAFEKLLSGDADSGIFSAVAAPEMLAADISARLPAISDADSDSGEFEEAEEDDDAMAELMRGGDDELPDDEEDAAEDDDAEADALMADLMRGGDDELPDDADDDDEADEDAESDALMADLLRGGDDDLPDDEDEASHESAADLLADLLDDGGEEAEAEAEAAPSDAALAADALDAAAADEDDAGLEHDHDDEEDFVFDPNSPLLSNDNVESMLVAGESPFDAREDASNAAMPESRTTIIDAPRGKMPKTTTSPQLPEGADLDSTMSFLGLDNDPPSDEFEYATATEVRSTDSDVIRAQAPRGDDTAPSTATEEEDEAITAVIDSDSPEVHEEESFDFDSLVSGMTGKLPEDADAEDAEEPVDASGLDDISALFDAPAGGTEEIHQADHDELMDSIASGMFGSEDDDDAASNEALADDLLGDIMSSGSGADADEDAATLLLDTFGDEDSDAEPAPSREQSAASSVAGAFSGSFSMDELAGGASPSSSAEAEDDDDDLSSMLAGLGGDDEAEPDAFAAMSAEIESELAPVPKPAPKPAPKAETAPVAPRRPQPSATSGPRTPKKARLPEDDLDEALRAKAEAHTMILTRSEIESAGSITVGVQDTSVAKVLVGVAGVALMIVAAAVYLWFSVLTGMI